MNIQELEKQFAKHEAVCSERWIETILRIKRIEHIMIAGAGAIIILLLSIVLRMG